MNNITCNILDQLDLLPEASIDDRVEIWNKVMMISGEISDKFRIDFASTEMPNGCQDGPKLGSIGVYCLFPKNDLGLKGFSIFEIEFSKVGNLFAFNSPLNDLSFLFSDLQLEEIRSDIQKYGFCFADNYKLNQKYTGSKNEFKNMTWKDRFFAIAV